MSLLVMLLFSLYVSVSGRNLKMALRYHSHPSLIKYDMKDFCDRNIELSGDGRNSGGVLSLKIPLDDISSNFSCTTALKAPRNHLVLVALKKMKIPIPDASCSDYVMIFNGGLNSTDLLSNKICGYYDDNHSSRLVYYSRTTSSAISIKVSKEAREVYNFDFGVTFTFTAFSRSRRRTCPGRDQMLCDNAICIWKHFKCNDHNNCGDGSDEKECGNDFPASEEPDSYKLRFPTALAAVLFVGILLIIITAILVILCYKRCYTFCCCARLFLAAPRRRHRSPRRGAATVATLSDQSSTFGYDNSGFIPDPPPSYEEVTVTENVQRPNEQMSDPPDYRTACKILFCDQTSSENANETRSELPIWRQVMSIKF